MKGLRSRIGGHSPRIDRGSESEFPIDYWARVADPSIEVASVLRGSGPPIDDLDPSNEVASVLCGYCDLGGMVGVADWRPHPTNRPGTPSWSS
ncbi:hypothetical protein CDL15_Pgr010196 [Punica granatum]|uniref:Uncharacterized protein n=1 Tax=Punica granatum TaxID=22663 RepID=A0A218XQF3_PUNGR|nr:hypothetical protein CDL15_Pgr010196 [Punica granatum]PKI70584.1 hypothetical protein CRG98_009089 [Punica granatum]